jgi:polyphosphate kinase 2 (PPK2 family)
MDKRATKILNRLRVVDGQKFRLKDHDPGETCGLDFDKGDARDLLKRGTERLSELQDQLYAQDRWAVLCIFQAMDAAGKDGAIKHVFSGVNPQGCHVTAFKAPGPQALEHDFLWRHTIALPERGVIGIHNRSWYEEVLVAEADRQADLGRTARRHRRL